MCEYGEEFLQKKRSEFVEIRVAVASGVWGLPVEMQKELNACQHDG